jgi:hypothetical protein
VHLLAEPARTLADARAKRELGAVSGYASLVWHLLVRERRFNEFARVEALAAAKAAQLAAARALAPEAVLALETRARGTGDGG